MSTRRSTGQQCDAGTGAGRRGRTAAGLAIAGAAALLVVQVAFPGSARTEPPAGLDHLYVTAAGSDRLLGYDLIPGAAPRPNPAATETTGFGALSVKASADGRFLYTLSVLPTPAIHVFAIAADGGLTTVPGAPVVVTLPPLGMNVSPDGRHLVLISGPDSGGNAVVQGFSVSADGVPAPQGAPVRVGSLAASGPVPMAAVSPDNRHVYVSDYLAGTVTRYELDGENGAVSPARETVAVGGGPVSPTVSADGRFLFAACEHAGGVAVLGIDPASGRLNPVPGSPFPAAGLVPHGIGLSPDGRLLYTPDAVTNDVSGYAVQADGSLRPLPGSPYPGGPLGTLPGQVFVSSDGGSLYGVDLAGGSTAGSAAVRSYRIGPDGALTGDPIAPVNTGVVFSAASVLVPGR
ncbi:lactonase family protein [Nocardia asteroides]|uniref:lactonase family protein n=1 Tax=Nocardia asteroides TaxID=1824 RepID=UPI0037CA2ADE